MAGVSGWYGTAYNCAADPSKSHGVGWYQDGQLLASTYKNPATGAAYTPQELSGLIGGGATTPTGGTTPTGEIPGAPPELATDIPGYKPPAPPESPTEDIYHWNPVTKAWVTDVSKLPEGGNYSHEGAVAPTRPTAPTPTFGEGAVAGIPTPEVTPAPPYEISPEQQAFEDMYGGKLTDWVESGGYGIPEETQNLMIQKQTDSLKARETENIRVMRNNMERRGITNSGFVTSVAIAGAIADVQIKSALMKMSSFEKAMGQAGQFLGYLSEQSQLKYQPEFATWQAEQMAKMQVWQGKMDIMKMEINQAYQTQNMQLQAQLTSQLNQQQHQYDIELAEMELEANQKAATAQGAGNLFGTILGFIFGK